MSDTSDVKNNKAVSEKDDFSEVYKTYSPVLYNYGISLGFPRETCLDAIHDVFYKFFSIKTTQPELSNIKYYLLRSLKNRLLDIRKKDKNLNFLDAAELPFTIDVTIADALIEKEEEILIKNKVEHLLSCLTDRQREAVYLRYIQELEYEEISELLNINIESARILVYRGLERLKQQVGNDSLPLLLGIFTLMRQHFF